VGATAGSALRWSHRHGLAPSAPPAPTSSDADSAVAFAVVGAAPPLHVRIIGHDLPGRRFAEYDDVRVGVQRGRDVEQLVAGDASEAVFDVTVTPLAHGHARGPYVHGRGDDRFVYLVWVAAPGSTMFRRAKLRLDTVPPSVWATAGRAGHRLEGRLGLTDGRGGPRCARVPSSVIAWEAVPADEPPAG
jgi:hypothetical protein